MITKEQAIELGSQWGTVTLYHYRMRNRDGTALRARVNGKCKTWKREPERFQLPIKHGLRNCGYLADVNAHEWFTDEKDAERGYSRYPTKIKLSDGKVFAARLADYASYHRSSKGPNEPDSLVRRRLASRLLERGSFSLRKAPPEIVEMFLTAFENDSPEELMLTADWFEERGVVPTNEKEGSDDALTMSALLGTVGQAIKDALYARARWYVTARISTGRAMPMGDGIDQTLALIADWKANRI